jgi:cyclopropane fatty-acyl-phospholipid synthase-like methyltransferase
VELMRAWDLCGTASRVLDLGCGTGRMLEALAPQICEIVGADISQAMIQTAARRIQRFPNASVVRTSGEDLAELNGPFDLVLAIDSFPYLVQTGIAEAHIAACSALLSDRGYVLIMNYSYRGDVAKDREDVARLGARFGLSILQAGTRDLKLWDGTTFLLQKTT